MRSWVLVNYALGTEFKITWLGTGQARPQMLAYCSEGTNLISVINLETKKEHARFEGVQLKSKRDDSIRVWSTWYWNFVSSIRLSACQGDSKHRISGICPVWRVFEFRDIWCDSKRAGEESLLIHRSPRRYNFQFNYSECKNIYPIFLIFLFSWWLWGYHIQLEKRTLWNITCLEKNLIPSLHSWSLQFANWWCGQTLSEV